MKSIAHFSGNTPLRHSLSNLKTQRVAEKMLPLVSLQSQRKQRYLLVIFFYQILLYAQMYSKLNIDIPGPDRKKTQKSASFFLWPFL